MRIQKEGEKELTRRNDEGRGGKEERIGKKGPCLFLLLRLWIVYGR